MISKDPLQLSNPSLPAEDTPLFRDPRTGRELLYNEAAAELKSLLTRSGFPELASGLHSLRIGGATCAAAQGGDYIAGCLGLWSSTTKYTYLYAMRDTLEDTCYKMSRGSSGPLAVRPGPVGSFAPARSF
jgi:hypothetical protein